MLKRQTCGFTFLAVPFLLLAINGHPMVMGQEADTGESQPPAKVKKWPNNYVASKEFEKRPGPWRDGSDLTIWPNRVSRANSDAWIAQNHDRIRLMRPRLLLINFSNEHSNAQLKELTKKLIDCLAEASRYHGYRDSKSPRSYSMRSFISLTCGIRSERQAIPNWCQSRTPTQNVASISNTPSFSLTGSRN